MLAKLKLIGLSILGVATALFYALLQREKKERAEEEVKTTQAARKYEKAASDALSDGLQKEAKVSNEKPDTDIVNHFK